MGVAHFPFVLCDTGWECEMVDLCPFLVVNGVEVLWHSFSLKLKVTSNVFQTGASPIEGETSCPCLMVPKKMLQQ